MKKIATIGEILVEIMATEPGEGFREPIPLVGPFPSGAPAIFIDQAALLGQPCGIISRVGNDDFGRLNLDRLARDGVDVSAIAVDADAVTGSAFVRYRPSGVRNFVFNIKHSACGSTVLDAAARTLVSGCDHLHVMGTSLFAPNLVAATNEAIAIVKAKGGTVSFDPNLRQEMLHLPGLRDALDGIFARCDLFMPSGPELFLFTKATEEERAVAEILERDIAAVVVKRGGEGAVYYDATVSVECSAFPIEEIDPTGAGDCFGATFVCCWLRGMAPEAALKLAAASGALAVTKRGPMEGTTSMRELEEFVAAHGRGVL